ncbi:MAG: MsnO8 family LLM class oxidoreductase [Gammaproteobacteria bacterium]|nr:MsnO8 family LLM class oxidoreductase [Gammaproteobacteria bacterium]
MLMHYSPLKVAEWLKMLQVLHPGRIDLGIGRAPGSDGITAAALAYGSRLGVEYFPAKMADLIAFLNDRTPHTEALAAVTAAPPVERPPESVECWAQSEEGAKLAAYFGLPFSYAHFISPEHARRACDTYREEFRPSEQLAEPQVNLGVFALCSEDEAEVEDLARCRDVWRLRVERGEFGPIPSVEEAKAYRMTDEETEPGGTAARRHQILGTPDVVGERLRGLAEDLGAVEMSIVSITHDFAARVRGYELMAGAMHD